MNREISKALALFTQISVSMVVPIFICFFIGRTLDRLLNINGIFLIIFTVMGIMAGFRSVYVLVRGFYKGKDTYVDIEKIKNHLIDDNMVVK
ncbi:MAG: AtpZ/AtpI family protein, partial [Clostridia bacterium]|nr:AtpZ/AtpI family protein [Clostridia bacterium]